MKRRYNTIVFDLGNTLIRFDHNIAVDKLKKRFGIDPKVTYQLFFDSPLTHLFEKGLISTEEFYKEALKLLGIDIPYGEFIPLWNDIFWEDAESCEIAKKLKSNYRLFLLSNVNRSHFEHIQSKFSIIKIFDKLILSFVEGAMKPEKAIYDKVIELAGGDPSGVLYIDDREDLVKEAKGLGIDSIRYETAGKLKKELLARGVVKD